MEGEEEEVLEKKKGKGGQEAVAVREGSNVGSLLLSFWLASVVHGKCYTKTIKISASVFPHKAIFF